MDDLPELPLNKLLNLKNKLNSFKANSLCYSERPMEFIIGKSRMINGQFAQNVICEPDFKSFFKLNKSTFTNLKHLRLCQISLNEANEAFVPLNSFGQLEDLQLYDVKGASAVLELNLPMLTSIQLDYLDEIKKLTLMAPILQKIKLAECGSLELVIVHTKTVGKVTTDKDYLKVSQLKNLTHLFIKKCPETIDSEFLTSLKHLEEIHLGDRSWVRSLFQQKQQHERVGLKIFLCGLLLNNPNELAIVNAFTRFNSSTDSKFLLWVYALENRSGLADEIPFCTSIPYMEMRTAVPELQASILARLTDLIEITVCKLVSDQEVQVFLSFLQNHPHIVALQFYDDQPRQLFERLPEYPAIQALTINSVLTEFDFLFRLKNLVFLSVWSVSLRTIRKVLEELEFLERFDFDFASEKIITIEIERRVGQTDFVITVREQPSDRLDLDAAMRFIEKLSRRKSSAKLSRKRKR